MDQRTLDEALENYRKGFVIFEQLAASAPSNTQWQYDLSISYNNLGDVLKAQSNLDEALK